MGCLGQKPLSGSPPPATFPLEASPGLPTLPLPFPMATKRKRIVLKFGSGILTNARGTSPDLAQFRRLCAEVAGLVKQGHQVTIVSSGAVAAGLAVLLCRPLFRSRANSSTL